ncbi:MAG TPA: LLM class flavin-dependent oxidoreductase, partial [Thermomicrobiales bacterium]|nr:LLM class flavin-dependent oxidoreductase [Thermomicrobiales bacterium]
QIAHHMWSGNTAPYIGKHYRLERPINEPGPISDPHPPIVIGGSGERKTLRLVAQYGDACNLLGADDPDTLRHKLDVLRRHCDDIGRPYDAITKTITTSLRLGDGTNGTETAEQAIERLQTYADLGVKRVSFVMPDLQDPRTIERFGREIVPYMGAMSPMTPERTAAGPASSI